MLLSLNLITKPQYLQFVRVLPSTAETCLAHETRQIKELGVAGSLAPVLCRFVHLDRHSFPQTH
jgi:hypothetical protein